MLLNASECFWPLLNAPERFGTRNLHGYYGFGSRWAGDTWPKNLRSRFFEKKIDFFFEKNRFFFLAQKNSWVNLGMGKHPNHRFSMFSGPSVRSFEYFGEQIIRRAFCAPVEPTCYGIWYRLKVREKL